MSADEGAPLLVTGMPRTATSWVGKMLEASGALVYVNEPLNPQHPPGRSPGVLRADVTHAFQYISEYNERVWLPAFQDTVRLRFHPLAEVRRNHGPYDLLRALKYTAGFGLGRLRGRRACSTTPPQPAVNNRNTTTTRGQPRASSVLLSSPIRPSTPGQS